IERSEKCFKEGQLWAAYDDRDGMPRNYAIVHKVISLNPFKMKVCWLSSKPNKKPVPFPGSWKRMVSFNQENMKPLPTLNISHTKLAFQSRKTVTFVFSQKKKVCALYKSDKTPDPIKYTYEIVEVDESSKETGITVTPLVEVAGFKTGFHRHPDSKETKVIPEKDFLKISHQIPSYLLTGQESAKAPKGCLNLDPAAIPLEFLHVLADVKEADKMDIDNVSRRE
ncbi:DnaJ domain-containing protein, partial [Tanacetum coccineum]